MTLAVAAAAQGIPTTGDAAAGLEAFDQAVINLMNRYQLPGAALAVMRDGRLVMARGYGYADRDSRVLVQPDSLFRIASISKPITAAAIQKLVEQGKLDPNARAFQLLSRLRPRTGASIDPRISDITIRHLLRHEGGWDRDGTGYDPMFDVLRIAQEMGEAPPASCELIIRYMLGRSLDFTPGTRSSYSNFGYCVLGRVIEEVTGQNYQSFVRANILGPLGGNRSALGKTLQADRLPDEVFYYDYPGAPLARSVFPTGPLTVPFPYGGFFLGAHDANGGWVSNTIELLRFLGATNASRGPRLLLPVASAAGTYLAFPPEGPGWGWLFNGALPGNIGTLRLDGRTGWCFLTNSRPQAFSNLLTESDTALLSAARGVTVWPGGDLFPRFAASFAVANAASFIANPVAPDQFVTLFGAGLATGVALADVVPLPTTLGGVTVTLTDSVGATRSVALHYVSPTQINFVMPAQARPGPGTISVATQGRTLQAMIQVEPVSPGLFTANSSGVGVAAALAFRESSTGGRTPLAVYTCPAPGACTPVPLDLGGETDRVVVQLFGTGIRYAGDLARVRVSVGGQTPALLYAGAQPQYAGLDQINLVLPRALVGRGEVDVVVEVDGRRANAVRLRVR